MSYIVADVMRVLEKLAPLSLVEPWDNCGLLLGSSEQPINKVSVCLDIDSTIVEQAIDSGVGLIVTHHPLIFSGIKHVNESVPEMRNLASLIRHGIAVYAAHTNLDAAVGGVNDCLAKVLGLKVKDTLFPSSIPGGYFNGKCDVLSGFVRVGEYEEAMDYKSFLVRVNQHLQTSGCFVSGVTEHAIKRVALSGGSSDEAWTEEIAASGVDAYIAGEIKHHQLIALEERGVRAIAAGHDCTERVVLEPLAAYLMTELSELEVFANTGLDYNLLF